MSRPIELIKTELTILRSKEDICYADIRAINKEIEALQAKMKPYQVQLADADARLGRLVSQIHECESALERLETVK
jgi:chromosome segregation ATPase